MPPKAQEYTTYNWLPYEENCTAMVTLDGPSGMLLDEEAYEKTLEELRELESKNPRTIIIDAKKVWIVRAEVLVAILELITKFENCRERSILFIGLSHELNALLTLFGKDHLFESQGDIVAEAAPEETQDSQAHVLQAALNKFRYILDSGRDSL